MPAAHLDVLIELLLGVPTRPKDSDDD
jgi:hypothetical protein